MTENGQNEPNERDHKRLGRELDLFIFSDAVSKESRGFYKPPAAHGWGFFFIRCYLRRMLARNTIAPDASTVKSVPLIDSHRILFTTP